MAKNQKLDMIESEVCKNSLHMIKNQVDVYEKSLKIQFILFILFLLVLCWLFYHYAQTHMKYEK